MTLAFLLALHACRHPVRPAGAPVTGAASIELLERVRSAGLPPVLRSGLRLRVERGGPVPPGLAHGGLLLAPPGRFRLELSGPFGPPAVIASSDGEDAALWLASRDTLYRGSPAELTASLGGGGSDLVGLLLAVPPAAPSEPGELGPGEIGPRFRFDLPEGGSAELEIDPRELAMSWLELTDGSGSTALRLDYERFRPTAGRRFPTRIRVDLPGIALQASLELDGWEALDGPPPSFHLGLPPGARAAELRELLAAAPPGR